MQTAKLLTAVRVNRIMKGIDDPRLLAPNLRWSPRVRRVNAMDGEINARSIGHIQSADLLADDSQAVIRTSGRIQLESYKLPNIKTGIGFNQETLALFARINSMGYSQQELDFAVTRINGAIERAKAGVDQRIEHLTQTMLADGVGMTYDRLGIKLTNPSWGMYSDLKVNAGTTWDVAATATPVADIWGLRLVGQRHYGITYDRATMSTPAFQAMIATTEFQAKARMSLAPNVSYTNLTLSNLDQQRNFAQNILAMEIELDDSRYWQETTAGVVSSFPFMPLGNVILTAKQNDGNTAAWDFANAQVVESMVAQAVGGSTGIIGNLEQGYGTVGYATLASHDMNPPGLNVWAVARGWPRKFQLQASAVLYVGALTDSISTSLPF